MKTKVLREGYRSIYVETFYDGYVRVRPLAGQWADVGLVVQCSKAMRARYPVGSVFRLESKLSMKLGTRLLYCPPNADYELVDRAVAQAAIRSGGR